MDLGPGSPSRAFLNKELFQSYYEPFYNWYFSNFSSTKLENFKNQYYEYLSQTQKLEHFVPWFLQYYVDTYSLNTIESKP